MFMKVLGLVLALLTVAPAAVTAQDKPLLREQAVLSLWLDKNGGYRDKAGGYYDPSAGTYTDKDGGAVDNWKGYTYKDGSYKSALGDYYDAPKREFQLANGEVAKLPAGYTNADAIRVMRENVAENGGFDKDFIRRGMFETILKEHRVENQPPRPPGR
ncbi:MAG TPA: hypothetical protein VFN88_14080 [Caulobacteraceae bacterium]|nr:hypothetical protein [Caulobacteraceae bacterium]